MLLFHAFWPFFNRDIPLVPKSAFPGRHMEWTPHAMILKITLICGKLLFVGLVRSRRIKSSTFFGFGVRLASRPKQEPFAAESPWQNMMEMISLFKQKKVWRKRTTEQTVTCLWNEINFQKSHPHFWKNTSATHFRDGYVGKISHFKYP